MGNINKAKAKANKAKNKITAKCGKTAKKCIAILFALTAITATAIESFSLAKNQTASLDDPIIIRSVYALNPDAGNNLNESNASLSFDIETTYYRHVPILVPVSNGKVKAYDWFDLQLWYGGSTIIPIGYSKLRMNRVNTAIIPSLNTIYSQDPYLYEGEAYGLYTNTIFASGVVKSDGISFPGNMGPVSSTNDIYAYTNVIYTKVRAYTVESNQTMCIECFMTNLMGNALPDVTYTNQVPLGMKAYANAKVSYNVGSSFFNIYSFTNTSNQAMFGALSLRGYVDPESPYTPSGLGEKNIPYKKIENFSITSVAPGTSAYAITNKLDYMLPPKFTIKATTVQPRTTIGVIFDR